MNGWGVRSRGSTDRVAELFIVHPNDGAGVGDTTGEGSLRSGFGHPEIVGRSNERNSLADDITLMT